MSGKFTFLFGNSVFCFLGILKVSFKFVFISCYSFHFMFLSLSFC